MSLKQPGRTGPGGSEQDADGERDSTDVLRLMNAEYTQSILGAIQQESKSARAIADECGASRPTVYRRLNALEDAGLVDSGMVYDADGHHRTVFETTLEAISVDLIGGELSVTVATSGSNRSTSRPPRRPSS
jgi:DNA invertase Pin-like site-specific DNA recombinase